MAGPEERVRTFVITPSYGAARVSTGLVGPKTGLMITHSLRLSPFHFILRYWILLRSSFLGVGGVCQCLANQHATLILPTQETFKDADVLAR